MLSMMLCLSVLMSMTPLQKSSLALTGGMTMILEMGWESGQSFFLILFSILWGSGLFILTLSFSVIGSKSPNRLGIASFLVMNVSLQGCSEALSGSLIYFTLSWSILFILTMSGALLLFSLIGLNGHTRLL